MSCPKNIKQFLFWEYEGSRDSEMMYVTEWAFNKYELHHSCKRCGNFEREFGIEYQDMLRRNIRIPNYKESYDPRKEIKA